MNKKFLSLLILFITLCFAIYISYLYLKPPIPFLSDDELIAEINKYDSSLQVQKTVDQIIVNERHYFVPVQFTDGRSGMSFWKWEKGKWQLLQFSTERVLRWQLDKNDPGTNYIVWDRQEKSEEEISVYLMRNREYNVSNNEHRYSPKIQLEHKIQIKSYGVEKLPKEWASTIMNIKQPYKQSGLGLFDTYFPEQYVIGVHYDDSMFSGNNSSSFGTGNADSTIESLIYIDESQLE